LTGNVAALTADRPFSRLRSPERIDTIETVETVTLALDHLPQPASPLSHLDPRWKLAALTLATLVVALLHTLPAVVLAMAGTLVLVVLGRLPVHWYLSRLGALLLFLTAFLVLVPFIVHDNGPGLNLGSLHFSWYGLRLAILLCLKALALVSLVLIGLTTAPLSASLKAAHALHVPGLLVQLVMLTHRYIFVLGAELSRLRTALRVRGYRNRASRHCYRTVGHVAGTLLVRGSERAERVAQAMRCRGFDGQFRSLTEFRTTHADLLFFFCLVGGAVALLFLDLLKSR
jgi:cobalt/nickel transport system permease protein